MRLLFVFLTLLSLSLATAVCQDNTVYPFIAGSSVDGSVFVSETTESWSAAGGNSKSIFSSVNAIAQTNKNFVIGVGTGPQDSVAYSINGVQWYGAGKECFLRGRSIGLRSTTRFCVGGEGGPNGICCASVLDGVTTTLIPAAIQVLDSVFSIDYGSGLRRWLIAGEGVNHTLAWSSSGIPTEWTGAGNDVFNIRANSVVAGLSPLGCAVGLGDNHTWLIPLTKVFLGSEADACSRLKVSLSHSVECDL